MFRRKYHQKKLHCHRIYTPCVYWQSFLSGGKSAVFRKIRYYAIVNLAKKEVLTDTHLYFIPINLGTLIVYDFISFPLSRVVYPAVQCSTYITSGYSNNRLCCLQQIDNNSFIFLVMFCSSHPVAIWCICRRTLNIIEMLALKCS